MSDPSLQIVQFTHESELVLLRRSCRRGIGLDSDSFQRVGLLAASLALLSVFTIISALANDVMTSLT